VILRTAGMAAGWMAAGFVHGVLNTDNMNMTGESFDYGPYRFLPRNDPNFVAAYFDQNGLYSFGRQPEAVFWNLQQLAGCLAQGEVDQDGLVAALNSFGGVYRDALAAAMLKRLGIKAESPEADVALAGSAFRALSIGGDVLRWEPFFFDWFCGDAGRAMTSPRRHLYEAAEFADFRALVGNRTAERPERLSAAYFEQADPQELLIDEIEAIWKGISGHDDWSAFEGKLADLEIARTAWNL